MRGLNLCGVRGLVSDQVVEWWITGGRGNRCVGKGYVTLGAPKRERGVSDVPGAFEPCGREWLV